MLELFSYGMEPWPGLNGAEVSRGSKQAKVFSLCKFTVLTGAIKGVILHYLLSF